MSGRAAGDALELVTLDVARITPYEHNPRRAANAEYDRIKASIRVDGLGQPLVITQRPGASDYVVHAGGNTRLRIPRPANRVSARSTVWSAPGRARPMSCSRILRKTIFAANSPFSTRRSRWPTPSDSCKTSVPTN